MLPEPVLPERLLPERLLPEPPPPGVDPSDHFARLAERLLGQAELCIAGQAARLQEIEFYWHAADHPDPFCHRDPLQYEPGRWYLHRVGSGYRGGSFKGLDFTFGNGIGSGGVLIRGIVLPSGRVVSGPSRVVDAILELTGTADVATLARRIQLRRVDDPDNLVHLRPAATPTSAGRPAPAATPAPAAIRGPAATSTLAATPAPPPAVFATPRVGLSLHGTRTTPQACYYWSRPYRFLTLPRALRAGRLQLILALYCQGYTPPAIAAICGSPVPTVERYIRAYRRGRRLRQPATLFRRSPRPEELCLLYGYCDAHAVPRPGPASP